ncbi:acyl-CoA dehydrogenase family protein [Alkalicoccus urumqiensis]|uniref:Acyl-CoA dehydrogenase n=1 Tax=Alkalicoccus urumqiensis TaxID=1548213 RepID=A0A2P6MJ18_ALKUR|nr:acyl-CoA dehydrogenase family protein [Alkalicoccus urumqiensis]PRO66275.1 acyl-CoA dehydrogenase [Alkalicoccus urumqiensis]
MTQFLHTWLEQHEEELKQQGFAHDKEGTFPEASVRRLQEAGYPAVTIPASIGGGGAGLTEWLKLQQRLASIDGALALSLGWHTGMMFHVQAYGLWEGALYEQLASEVVNTGALFNVAATERGSGSPTRGALPETKAVDTGTGWKLTGRKAFTTMLPVLDYAAVTAEVGDTGAQAQFLVPMDAPGVTMEEAWNMMSMRGTGSHDLVLNGVEIPQENKITLSHQEYEPVTAWLLHIPACYTGIAEAALNEACRFASEYSPGSLDTTISELSHIRDKIGTMELKLKEAEAAVYYAAHLWEQAADHERPHLKNHLAQAKHTATNRAQEIVDLAMRVGGAGSLSADSAMQRYYRDVRAGLHNPPMDDAVIAQLAETSLHQRGKKTAKKG